MRLDPDDGVPLLIKLGRPSKGLDRDVVLLQLVRFTLEVSLTNVREQLRQAWSTVENPCGQEGLKLQALTVEIRSRSHESPRMTSQPEYISAAAKAATP